jgi:hypothetical protein
MRWVTLLSTDNVEHTINMEAVVQIVRQSARSSRHSFSGK